MTQRKIVTRANYQPDEGRVEKGNSMTLQGEATDLNVLLTRFKLGQPLNEYIPAYGEEDPEHDDLDLQQVSNDDLSERGDLLAKIIDQKAEVERRWEEMKALAAKEKLEKNETAKTA